MSSLSFNDIIHCECTPQKDVRRQLSSYSYSFRMRDKQRIRQPSFTPSLLRHLLCPSDGLQPAALEQPRLRGDGVDELGVVGDDNHASAELLDAQGQRSQRLAVEVVRRLVENEEVGAAPHGRGKHQLHLAVLVCFVRLRQKRWRERERKVWRIVSRFGVTTAHVNVYKQWLRETRARWRRGFRWLSQQCFEDQF